MINLICYLAIGFVVILVEVLVHLIRAELKGYDTLNYWANKKVIVDSKDWVRVIFGLLIWPIRAIQAISLFKSCYKLYELKKTNSKKD